MAYFTDNAIFVIHLDMSCCEMRQGGSSDSGTMDTEAYDKAMTFVMLACQEPAINCHPTLGPAIHFTSMYQCDKHPALIDTSIA